MAKTYLNQIESGATISAQTRTDQNRKVSPFDTLLVSTWMNLEAIMWIGLVILAAATRLTDLGPRALHQDEATHATFSLDQYTGKQFFHYDPTWHGPFLYYMVSLSYFIFGGPSDTNARVAPALFGIGIVALCWALRPLIGKVGAFFAGFLVLFSPSILYYNRNLRHDTFAVFGELLFAVAVFRFLQNKPGQKIWWLALAGIGLSITYASHELVFMNTGILVGWLALAFVFEIIALPVGLKNRTGLFLWRKKAVANKEPVDLYGNNQEPVQTQISATFESEETTLSANKQSSLASNIPAAPSKSVLQKLMGNWKLLAVFFSLIIYAIWVFASINLFKTIEGTGDIPRVFSGGKAGGGIPEWVLMIPTGLLLAVLAGFFLGNLVALSWGKLERVPTQVAAVITAITFVVLGGFMVYRSLKPAANTGSETGLVGPSGDTVSTITTTTAASTKSTELVISNMAFPSIALQLFLVLLVAIFIGLVIGQLCQRGFLVYNGKGLYGFGVTFFGVVLVACLVSLRFALVTKDPTKPFNGLPRGNLFLVGPEVDKWQAYVFNGVLLGLVLGLVAGWLITLADLVTDEELRGSAALRGILRIFRQPVALAGFFGSFAIIYVLLFGNFFFYVEGIADGVYKGVEYWASVHGTRRLDQPWFYYLLLMLLYEPLASLLTFWALVTVPLAWVLRAIKKGRFVFTVRGLMLGYCLWWSVMAMISYSIAGEKVPWLNMQVALPAILVSAFVVDNASRRVHWRVLVKPSQGLLAGGLFILTLISVILGLLFFISPPDNGQNKIALAILAISLAVLGFGLSIWLWAKKMIQGKVMRTSALVVISIIFIVYGIKASIALNYDHPVTNTEPMIQVQTTPELMLFLQRLDRLSRDYRDSFQPNALIKAPNSQNQDPTGGKNLPILLAQSVAPPLTWYLRNFTDVNYFTPNNDTTQNSDAAPPKDGHNFPYAIIAVDKGEDQFKLQEQLRGQYTRLLFRRYWWFPEDDNGYGSIGKAPADSTNPNLDKKKIQNTDWGKLWSTFTSQPSAGQMWRYIMYRELSQSLSSYDMVVYVRNDLVGDFDLLGSATGTKTDTAQTTYGLTESSQAGQKNGQYKTPRTVAFAPNGDILVLDSGNGRVQRFTPGGKFLSSFGKVGTGDGQFNLAQYDGGPGGLVVDQDGYIYVADTWNYRIQKFDENGNFVMKWGQALDTKGDQNLAKLNPNGFYGPRGLAYDKNTGDLYVLDTGNRRVVVFNRDGQFLRQFGSEGSGPGQFDEPVSLAVSGEGKVYVTDLRNKRVEILNREGQFQGEFKVTDWKEQVLGEPYVALDSQSQLYVSDPANGRVLKYSADGKLLQQYGNTNGDILVNPVGLAVGSDGYLYVADAKRNSIAKIQL